MNESRRRPRSADISVTSLVDVAFTLLIVFIIIAPTMQSGVAVDLPRAEAPPLETNEESISLTLLRSGEMYVGNELIPEAGAALLLLAGHPAETPIFLRADRDVPYEQIMKVLGEITKLGFHRINLVAREDRS